MIKASVGGHILLIIVCLHGEMWGADDVTATAKEISHRATPTANLDEWPQFRGPGGDGHAAQKGLPVTWSEKKNVTWKTTIPGKGWSSPIVHDSKVWLTTATDQNRSLRVISIDCSTGDIVQNVEVFRKANPGKIHEKNSHATPTLLADGDKIYAHFGAHGTACLSVDGSIVWRTQNDYYHHHGPAGSPVILGDKLIFSCDGFDKPFYDKLLRPDVDDNQFVIALDKNTGDVRWKSPRNGRHSYSTPLLIDVDGVPQLISPGGNRVVAYNPETGEELWSCRYDGYSVTPCPVYAHGLVFVCTGFDNPSLLAIRPTGQGDVTESHVQWSLQQGVPLTPSPLVVDDEIYLVSDAGIATCLEATTGKQLWRQRLPGKFSASPVYADGRIYIQAENGVTHVLSPGKKYSKLATNRLPGETLATMAVAGSAFYIRAEHALYRVEKNGDDENEGEKIEARGKKR